MSNKIRWFTAGNRLLVSGAGTVSSGGEKEINAHGMEIYAWLFL